LTKSLEAPISTICILLSSCGETQLRSPRHTDPGLETSFGLKHLIKAPKTGIPADDFIGQMTGSACPEVVDPSSSKRILTTTMVSGTNLRQFFERSRLKGAVSPISVCSPSQSWPRSRDAAEDLLISNHAVAWECLRPGRVATASRPTWQFVCLLPMLLVFGPTAGTWLRDLQSRIASSSLSQSQEPIPLVLHSTYVAEVQLSHTLSAI
jgi:hypothetical protein